MPWRLPIDELVWGRWISDAGRRSVVWIVWRGAVAQTVVHADGRAAARADARDDGVTLDGAVLRLADRRLLHERTLGNLLGALPTLLPGMPRRWLALEDRKWLSRAVLTEAGRSEEGWAIHERIVFP
jgi:hypothetical protein